MKLANVAKTSTKAEFARSYIISYSEKANPIADKHGISGTGKPVKELPFKSAKCFYAEFVAHYLTMGYSTDALPSVSTFKYVLQDKDNLLPCELRMLRCKGAHASCEVCLNASKLLENKNRKFDQRGKKKYVACLNTDVVT